jgi:tetratricopeptide (TPR) repeat protein
MKSNRSAYGVLLRACGTSALSVLVAAVFAVSGMHVSAAGDPYNFDPTKAGQPEQRDYGQYGPFDYYDLKDTPRDALSLVERAHFGPKTLNEARRGDWCFFWGDMDYTLRAFPNHPRALVAMADFLTAHERPCGRHRKANPSPLDLAEEIESGGWQDLNPDYYFQTGIKFRPQYAATRILYGQYLEKAGRDKEALKQFIDAEKVEPNSADAHYSLGLAYFRQGNKDKAREHAERAYKLGEQKMLLKEKLIAAGLWSKK